MTVKVDGVAILGVVITLAACSGVCKEDDGVAVLELCHSGVVV